MMLMKPYVSLDIETTGLCPETCQVLEIGAVFDYLDRPLLECPTFHTYVRHKLYVGEPYALALNARIFKILANPPDNVKVCCLEDVPVELASWLQKCGCDTKTPHSLSFGGKNFGGFDRNFLRRIPMFDAMIPYKHRFYDAGNMYFDPAIDENLPSTQQCLERAGLPTYVAHEAVADAEAVAKLIRRRYNIPL
jgi:DNA polymerase III epsilon subunit-like protein